MSDYEKKLIQIYINYSNHYYTIAYMAEMELPALFVADESLAIEALRKMVDCGRELYHLQDVDA